MRRFLAEINDGFAIIGDKEFEHLSKVMRLGVNSQIIAFNGDGHDYLCQIAEIGKKTAKCEILSKQTSKKLPKKEITLYLALPKKEHLEIIVQKAVELGASKLALFYSEFSVNQQGVNYERLNQISVSASKQCERADLIKIQKVLSFSELLEQLKAEDIVLFANEREGKPFDFTTLKNFKKIGLIVGSEGGFSAKEKAALLKCEVESISLGERILRCETASIALLSLAGIMSEN